MDQVIKFLQSQKLLSIATSNAAGPWIANVYMGVSNDGRLFFVSPIDTKHSKMILDNPNIAFSVAWSDSVDSKNRKGVQGIGVCRIVESIDEMTNGLTALHKSIPDMQKLLTLDWILHNVWNSKVWVVTPSYIKYWDDEIYGEAESKEFVVSRESKR